MPKYMTKKLEETNNLAIFLNRCLKSLDSVLIFTEPRTFKTVQEEGGHDMCYLYCQCVLFESYATSLTKKLAHIVSVIEEYKGEFNSKWKFYALSKRIESIKKYGGDEDDYDENGNIITENISDNKLDIYSVIEDLYYDDWTDIVQNTEPTDLCEITTMLATNASITPTDLFRITLGKTILPSKIDGNGNVTKMTLDDVAMQKALDRVEADDLSTTLHLLCGAIQYMYSKIKILNKHKDNKDELNAIQDIAMSLLDFRIDDVIVKPDFKQVFETICKENKKWKRK